MCCPSKKVIKSYTKGFLCLGGLHEDTLCDILQAMAPTNVKTVHQTSLLHIESNLDRLGFLSPTYGQRSQQQTGQIALQSVLINKLPRILSAWAINPTTSSTVDTRVFLALRRLYEDKLCDTLQAIAQTNVEMIHQTSFLYI